MAVLWEYIDTVNLFVFSAILLFFFVTIFCMEGRLGLTDRIYLQGIIRLFKARQMFSKFHWKLMIVEMAIVRCVAEFAWTKDQHFDYSVHRYGGHLTLYQACDMEDCRQMPQLPQDAQQLIASILPMMPAGLLIPRFTLRVCYFDRKLHQLEDVLWFWCDVTDEQLGPLQQEMEAGYLEIDGPQLKQIAHFAPFPLQPGQLLTHFYNKGKDPDPDSSDTLALVQITDTLLPLLKSKKRKQLAAALSAHIVAGSPYKRIAICYRPRHFPVFQRTYYYPVKRRSVM